MTSAFDFDVAVVGAGVVGLSCGYYLGLSGKSVVVLEKERLIGQGVSSRNSEVIHAGLYYPTGSLKAEMCVRGRRLLYPFLQAHGVGYDKCGKIVVATSEAEIARVEAVAAQARTNDVEGLEMLTADQVHALEPQARALMGMLSPETGIFDTHGYMLALEGEIEARDGAVVGPSHLDQRGRLQPSPARNADNVHYDITPGFGRRAVLSRYRPSPPLESLASVRNLSTPRTTIPATSAQNAALTPAMAIPDAAVTNVTAAGISSRTALTRES